MRSYLVVGNQTLDQSPARGGHRRAGARGSGHLPDDDECRGDRGAGQGRPDPVWPSTAEMATNTGRIRPGLEMVRTVRPARIATLAPTVSTGPFQRDRGNVGGAARDPPSGVVSWARQIST